MDLITRQLMQEFNLKEFQVTNTVNLIDSGNTIPFIARYRKEQTGELSDITLRDLFDRLNYLRNLQNRKSEVIRIIDEQGNLTEELEAKINNAITLTEVEDLYRPFKPKKRTRATIAKEKGLEPLADIIYAQEITKGIIDQAAEPFVNPDKGVNTVDDAIAGACDIIAEVISDNADYRKVIRRVTFEKGLIISAAAKEESSVYDMYYDYREPICKIPSHRILAINRGENEEYLKVKVDIEDEEILNYLKEKVIINNKNIFISVLEATVSDAYKRLIEPSIEREVRNELTAKAEVKAIKVFSSNLKSLLLQPPLKDVVVMGFDPAYRTGCKIAVVDQTGKLLTTTTVYPTAPQNDVEGAKTELKNLIDKYKINIISIGNGTASRESEMFVAELIREIDSPVFYTIVNEAGASIYSASKLGSEEYPDINVSLRGAISIARRLQDPLAELVKIEPKHIGVGQYQHDVNQNQLDSSLTGVVEDAVNNVGVDLNTASPSLLQYVSGINKSIAKNIVQYREEKGTIKNRKELLKVVKLGPSAYTQCAGFLRIVNGENPFDNTAVHPESYSIAEKLLLKLGYSKDDISKGKFTDFKEKAQSINVADIAKELEVGIPTITDIIKELQKPGRDPRDEMPKSVLKTDVLKIEDLKPGMVLKGTVRNVIDFGVFVDIGIKNDGLVHISEMSDKYIRNPLDVVSVGDIVDVKVIKIDLDKGKVSLSMKDAGPRPSPELGRGAKA